MNISDIIIIIAVIILIYVMISNIYKKNKKNIDYNDNHNHNDNENYNNYNNDDDDDDLESISYYSNNALSKNKNKDKENKCYIFDNGKMHNDYKEVIATTTTMTNGKNIFNITEKPIKITKPSKKKIFNIISQFINELSNKSINAKTTSSLSDGWMSGLPIQNITDTSNEADGWKKQMKKLGLPTSIYTTPVKPSKLKLIKIKKYSSQETENEVQINCTFICQKISSYHQIIFNVSFWIDKRNVNEDRSLFNDNDNDNERNIELDSENSESLPIIIEKIHILGFRIYNNDSDNNTARKSFYNFKGIKNKDGMIDQNKLMEQVMQKRQARARDTNTRIDQAELLQIEQQNEILNRNNDIDNSDIIFDD
jgi:hypothetical protein